MVETNYKRPMTVARIVCWTQALYFSVTGPWPLIDIQSFQDVTGEKTDHWLVYTVALLGLASAAVLASIDVIFVTRKTISPIYLGDAAVELVFVFGWTLHAIRSALINRKSANRENWN